MNDKSVNGSFYLQSKVVRAKERLEMEWAAQGNPMKIETAPIEAPKDTKGSGASGAESSKNSHPSGEDKQT